MRDGDALLVMLGVIVDVRDVLRVGVCVAVAEGTTHSELGLAGLPEQLTSSDV